MGRPDIPSQESRQRLYEIVRRDAPFEERARDALALGEEYLGVDAAHLTRIDEETDHWQAVVTTDSADGLVPPGLELDLGMTYCRRVFDTGESLAIRDAPAEGWADDPAFESDDLHCYHGTLLLPDGEPYGTVCFVSKEPRSEPFSEAETMFAELVARLLERELERDRHEARLTRQTNLATVLNRVLRHNLRNGLAVIRGYAREMTDRLGEDGGGGRVLSKADDLLALSEKARQLDRILDADHEAAETEVADLVKSVVDEVRADYPDASLSVAHDDAVTAPVRPSLRRALRELVENAAKHGGPDPTVAVSVERVPNAVAVHVADDGPGLGDSEAAVLTTGAETPLVHGSGLGLWLAHWIVTGHGGTIDVAVDDGTTMTVRVPLRHDDIPEDYSRRLERPTDKYRAAFEEASDAMIIVDDDRRILEANPAASDLYGVDRPDLLGQPLSRFVPDEVDFEAEWQSFRRAGNEREMARVVTAEGRERRIEYTGTADIVPGQHLFVSRVVTEDGE